MDLPTPAWFTVADHCMQYIIKHAQERFPNDTWAQLLVFEQLYDFIEEHAAAQREEMRAQGKEVP